MEDEILTAEEVPIVRAKVSFRAGPAFVNKDELFEADDPVVKGRENLFTPAGGTVRTTAAVPGEVVSPPPFLVEGQDGAGAGSVGDEVPVPPDGTEGEATGDGSGEPLPAVERPAVTASKAAWVAYVRSLGFDSDTDGLKRADLIAVADQLEAAG